MRGFRLFPDVSSVAVEWRLLGFRLRTLGVLWCFFWVFTGSALLLVSTALGLTVIASGLLAALFVVGYTNRYDPELVMRETTVLKLLWSSTRNRLRTNDPVRD